MWTSVNLGECKITSFFWLPDGSPLQVRIVPVENLPTVVVTHSRIRQPLCDPHNCRSELGHSDFEHVGKTEIGRSPGVYES